VTVITEGVHICETRAKIIDKVELLSRHQHSLTLMCILRCEMSRVSIAVMKYSPTLLMSTWLLFTTS